MQLEDNTKQYETKLRRALINESDQESEAYSQIKVHYNINKSITCHKFVSDLS